MQDTKENITLVDTKNKYYWKHRNETSLEFFRIHKKLKEACDSRQNFMHKWMNVISTYKTLNSIHKSLIAKQNQIANLDRLKRDKFRLWKHSKRTIEAIKRARKNKILSTVLRINKARYQLKEGILKNKAHEMLDIFFKNVFIVTELNKKLKHFSTKGNLISKQNQIVYH